MTTTKQLSDPYKLTKAQREYIEILLRFETVFHRDCNDPGYQQHATPDSNIRKGEFDGRGDKPLAALKALGLLADTHASESGAYTIAWLHYDNAIAYLNWRLQKQAEKTQRYTANDKPETFTRFQESLLEESRLRSQIAVLQANKTYLKK